MLKIRKSNDRGYAEHGWLKSRHTFSFAEYYDPQYMGFGPLRVINEDRIEGGTGFGAHPHRDMEIISYVVKGGLRHKDNMGNETVIKPGEVQRMSAGTGVVHSEYNDEATEETHFFQIWIQPNRRGLTPGYGQKSFAKDLATQKLVHVISADGRNGSIAIEQDADMYISRLNKFDTFDYVVPPGRKLWIQVVSGEVEIAGHSLQAGDAVAGEALSTAEIKADSQTELIIFELP